MNHHCANKTFCVCIFAYNCNYEDNLNMTVNVIKIICVLGYKNLYLNNVLFNVMPLK